MDTGKYFDKYWLSMNASISDARSLEKAAIADRLLGVVDGPILDVGCGRGVVASYLIGRGRKVVGVDASPVAVREAAGAGVEATVLDLETGTIEGRYAAVMCLDILQHSPYPLDLLRKILLAVCDEGVVIISLPNEFHILRRIGIVFGRHRFARYDGPHPRLFWRDEMLRLVREAGLWAEAIVPVPLTAPRHRLAAPVGKVLARVFPSLMAIGYVIKARRQPDEGTSGY